MLSKEQVTTLRTKLQKLLDDNAAALGFDVKLGNAKYLDLVTFVKVIAVPRGKGGAPVTTPAEQDFKRYHLRFGMKEADIGRRFTLRGRNFKLVGSNGRSRKYPLLAVDLASGMQYKLAVPDVVAALAASNS